MQQIRNEYAENSENVEFPPINDKFYEEFDKKQSFVSIRSLGTNRLIMKSNGPRIGRLRLPAKTLQDKTNQVQQEWERINNEVRPHHSPDNLTTKGYIQAGYS